MALMAQEAYFVKNMMLGKEFIRKLFEHAGSSYAIDQSYENTKVKSTLKMSWTPHLALALPLPPPIRFDHFLSLSVAHWLALIEFTDLTLVLEYKNSVFQVKN